MSKAFSLAQYQRHAVHLMSRVLNVRTNASPFTLVLDDLNQRSDLFIAEIVRRALSRNINVVFVTFESRPSIAPIRTVQGYGLTGEEILRDLSKAMSDCKESLVVVDNLYELINNKGIEMIRLFDLVANKFASTLVGVFHTDMLKAPKALSSVLTPTTAAALSSRQSSDASLVVQRVRRTFCVRLGTRISTRLFPVCLLER